VVPGLVCEEGEGCGFFGLGWQALLVDGGEGRVAGKAIAKLGEEGRVASSSAGDYVVDGTHGVGEEEHPAFDGVGDGGSGEGGGGGYCVFGAEIFRGTVFAAGFQEALGVGFTVLLSSRGFGWGLAEEFFFEGGVDDRGEDFSAGGDAAVAVVGLREELLGESIDDHVAGAGVERDDFCLARACGDGGEVADAADVLEDAGAARVREEDVVEKGNEGRALASGGHVGGAEVGDDRKAGGGCDEGGLAELPGAGDAAACVGGGDALVVDGLSVAADENGFDFCLGYGGLDGFGVGEAEAPVQAAYLGGGDGLYLGLTGHGGEDASAKCG